MKKKSLLIETGDICQIRVSHDELENNISMCMNELAHYAYPKSNDNSAYNPKILTITDSNIEKIYAGKVHDMLRRHTSDYHKIVLEASEKIKSMDSMTQILNSLLEFNFNKNDIIIALGGGTVGDLAGFVASIYMRGVKLVSIPTTLLAMIDSSIGGKNAVNFIDNKNCIGNIYQPTHIIIDYIFLNTLPELELKNGLSELIKYACLSKKFSSLTEIAQKFDSENGSFKDLIPNFSLLIPKAIRFKSKYIAKDPRDRYKRKCLNFGHTVGHAIESLSDYSIPHGIAVAKGMYHECKWLYNTQVTNYDFLLKLEAMLKQFGYDLTLEYEWDDILKKITKDKKYENGTILQVCPKDFGKWRLKKISYEH